MKKLFAVAGMGVALCSAAAFADPDPTRVPLQNAIETVGGQAAQHPGNRGLANATIRLQENAIRQQEKRDEHAQRREAAAAERADRPDRPDRPAMDRPGASEVAASRPGRADPPGLARGRR